MLISKPWLLRALILFSRIFVTRFDPLKVMNQFRPVNFNLHMMSIPSISDSHRQIIDLPPASKIFLEGPAGTGKSTVGIERMLYLMNSGVAGNSILVIVPQRTLGVPYMDAMNAPGVAAGGMVSVVTLSGLARRMVELFWPTVAETAGFARPDIPPTFLNLETAQYYMAHIVRPLLGDGLLASVTIDRNRLYSQIIDNLNKAAIVGFPYNEIGDRLKSAWSGEPGQSRVYDDAQTCASMFREYCLKHNLLDFSLQIEIFWQHLWKSELCKEYLINSYQHLIVDNVEEDVPVTHDLLAEWLPRAQSCLVIYDSDAGYRRFLGADPLSAHGLIEYCNLPYTFTDSYVTSPEIRSLAAHLKNSLLHKSSPSVEVDPRQALTHQTHTYYPQMLDWVAAQIENLINDDGIHPKDIVVLAPFLSDSLRYSIVNRLESKQIPVKTHRPSRSLREEPATICLFTLAAFAHPEWGAAPTIFDVAQCLMQSIEGLDLIRAKILAENVFRVHEGNFSFLPFDQIPTSIQERVSYLMGKSTKDYACGWKNTVNLVRESWTILSAVFLVRSFHSPDMVFTSVLIMDKQQPTWLI